MCRSTQNRSSAIPATVIVQGGKVSTEAFERRNADHVPEREESTTAVLVSWGSCFAAGSKAAFYA